MIFLIPVVPHMPRSGKTRRARMRALVILAGLMTLLWRADFTRVLSAKKHLPAGESPHSVASFVHAKQPAFLSETHGRHGLIIAADPSDFGCPPCYEELERNAADMSFLAEEERARRGVFLIRQAPTGPWSDSSIVHRWASVQGFPFPVFLVPESTYQSFGLPKTTLLIVDDQFRTLLSTTVPMTRTQRDQVLSLMEE